MCSDIVTLFKNRVNMVASLALFYFTHNSALGYVVTTHNVTHITLPSLICAIVMHSLVETCCTRIAVSPLCDNI